MTAGDAPLVLESVVASHEGRGSAAIDLLGPAARRGYEDAYEVGLGIGNVREQLASAFEASGRPDSALVYQSLIVQRYAMNGDGFPAVTLPLVELRIIANALRCGQIEVAERTWQRMSRDVDRPDPELARLMEEEAKALSNARAMQPRP
jgi:hypothetical protein